MKPIHPLAALFPMLPDEDLNALGEDIADNGLREPIRVWDDQVIDGQNRQEACSRAGVDPKYRDFEGDEDDVKAFIISKNVARRHLTKGQQAMAYALIYPDDGGVGGRGKKGTEINPAVTAGFSSRLLKKARQVLNRSEDLAKDVLAGIASLDDVLEAMKPKPAETAPEPKPVNVRRQMVRDQLAASQTEINRALGAGFTPEPPRPVYQGPVTRPEVTPVQVSAPAPIQVKPNGQCFGCKSKDRELAEARGKLSAAEANRERLYKENKTLNEQVRDIREDAALLNQIRKFLPAEQWDALLTDMRDNV